MAADAGYVVVDTSFLQGPKMKEIRLLLWKRTKKKKPISTKIPNF